MPRNITIYSSGSEHYSASEGEGSGIRISSNDSRSQEELYSEESFEEDDEDDFEVIDDDELRPSDSASSPRDASRSHRVPPRVRPAPQPRTSSRSVEEPPRRRKTHRETRYRDRSEHSAPRRRPVSAVDFESVDHYADDYPGYPPRGALPHHPVGQWAHIPQHSGPPTGYAPSMLSGAPFAPNPLAGAGPSNALVPLQGDMYGYQQNPFATPGNIFAPGPPTSGASMTGGYLAGEMNPRPQLRHQHRHSMGMPGQSHMAPAGAMTQYYQGFDPHGMSYGMPPPHMGYGYPYSMDRPERRRSHSRRRHPLDSRDHSMHRESPPPQVSAAGPAPVVQMPPPPPPVPMPLEPPKPHEPTPAEREAAERLKKLEDLLMQQAQARADKIAAKEQALKDAEAAAALKKRQEEEDKLTKLHELIIKQREEQIARDKAIEAKAAADKAEADAKAAKEAAEKQKAAEDAAKLLAAAKKAREDAEAKAAEEAKKAKEAHEKALAEAAAAQEALKKEKEEAEKKAAEDAKKAEEEKAKLEAEKKKVEEEKAAAEAAAAAPPAEPPKPPIKFKDAVGRKFSFPWHLCKTWRGMEDLIKQAFLHVDVIGQHVHEGHYDLVGPDGEIILPQVWETMIQPEMTITMHMWPMEEPPKKEPAPPPPPIIPGLGPDPYVMLSPHPHGHPPPLGHLKPKKEKANKPKKPPVGVGAPMPPPPPPPPPIVMMGPDGGMPPGIIEVPSPLDPGPPPKPGARPIVKKKQPANVGFLRWTAGGAVRSSGKGPKKLESPTGHSAAPSATNGGTATAHHAHHAPNGSEQGCVLM